MLYHGTSQSYPHHFLIHLTWTPHVHWASSSSFVKAVYADELARPHSFFNPRDIPEGGCNHVPCPFPIPKHFCSGDLKGIGGSNATKGPLSLQLKSVRPKIKLYRKALSLLGTLYIDLCKKEIHCLSCARVRANHLNKRKILMKAGATGALRAKKAVPQRRKHDPRVNLHQH